MATPGVTAAPERATHRRPMLPRHHAAPSTVLCAWALCACGAGGGLDDSGGAGDPSAGAAGPGAGGGQTVIGGGIPAGGSFNLGGDTPAMGFEPTDPANCEGIQQQAETIGGEADIIWIIDNSGSMADETAIIQQGMNDFSNALTSSGVDARVVVLSDTSPPTAPATLVLGLPIPLPSLGVCVPAPLGSGSCPQDTNLAAGFLHWSEFAIDSWGGLSIFQTTYPNWEAHLRPGSSKMIVMVTDDNSALPAMDFLNWVNAQPKFASAPSWKFSGIYCPGNVPANPNCSRQGLEYDTLIGATGGVMGDLGAGTGFQNVIDDIARLVVAESRPVDCEWVIPPPPEGQTFDANKVNVNYTDGAGGLHQLFGVPDAASCDPAEGGWFYDDPGAPRRVVACGTSCTTMQADTGARVEIQFGCETRTKIR